jgi:hypothetical protein
MPGSISVEVGDGWGRSLDVGDGTMSLKRLPDWLEPKLPDHEKIGRACSNGIDADCVSAKEVEGSEFLRNDPT